MDHIDHFLDFLSDNLHILLVEVASCTDPHCVSHIDIIEIFLESILGCLSEASSKTFPSIVHTRVHTTPGWNDAAKNLKYNANFWHRMWLEAGPLEFCFS